MSSRPPSPERSWSRSKTPAANRRKAGIASVAIIAAIIILIFVLRTIWHADTLEEEQAVEQTTQG